MFIQITIPGWFFGVLICCVFWLIIVIIIIVIIIVNYKENNKSIKYLFCKNRIKKGHKKCPFSFEK